MDNTCLGRFRTRPSWVAYFSSGIVFLLHWTTCLEAFAHFEICILRAFDASAPSSGGVIQIRNRRGWLVGVCLPDNESIFQWEDIHTFKKVFVETNMVKILKKCG